MSNQLLPCPFCQNPAEEVSGCKGWFSCADEECPAWHIQAKAEDWNRRATQPAAGEPVAYVPAATMARLKPGRAVPATLFAPPIPEEHYGVPVFLAPPAAAHGDEAVRKDAEAAYVEMTCQPVLIDGAHHYYLSSERMQAFDRLFSVDVSDAAIRAQVDGGIGDA